MVYQDESTRDWLAGQAPNVVTWECSRLKVVGLDAIPTYKRVVVRFPSPVEGTERLLSRLRRLNQGVVTGNRKDYERKEEPNGFRLVLRIDTASVTVMGGLRWRPFSGVGQALSRKGRNSRQR